MVSRRFAEGKRAPAHGCGRGRCSRPASHPASRPGLFTRLHRAERVGIILWKGRTPEVRPSQAVNAPTKRFILFAREPVRGRVKTRLAREIGPAAATSLYAACPSAFAA